MKLALPAGCTASRSTSTPAKPLAVASLTRFATALALLTGVARILVDTAASNPPVSLLKSETVGYSGSAWDLANVMIDCVVAVMPSLLTVPSERREYVEPRPTALRLDENCWRFVYDAGTCPSA